MLTRRKSIPIVAPPARQLPWTHNVIIFSQSKRLEEHEFYLRLAIHEQWSKRELERQFRTALFERTVLDPPKVSAALTQIHPEALSIFKNRNTHSAARSLRHSSPTTKPFCRTRQSSKPNFTSSINWRLRTVIHDLSRSRESQTTYEHLNYSDSIAEIFATDHGGCLPVFFDDAFAYTDPERVQSLQRMLNLAAHRGLQGIVLTCAPADYSALGAEEARLS